MYRITTAILAWALCIASASGTAISEFTPQGRVAKVESIKLTFDSPAADFGDARAQAPVDVSCNDPKLKGHGRWLDAKRWTYDFSDAPGPGVSCTAAVRPSFRTPAGEALTGERSFSFQTGGPVVISSQPYETTIDEDQVFVLRFNGDVDPATLLEHAHCLVEGLGEAVPVRLIEGDARKEILKSVFYSMSEAWDTPSAQLVQCKRLLPADATVQLVIGPGVATPGVATPGVATPTSPGRAPVASLEAEVFDYKVRQAFKASLTCLRENSGMPCTPVAPIAIEFTAPIAEADARQLRLETPSQILKPGMDENGTYRGGLTRVEFAGPFPELSDLTLVLPGGLKDDAGRELVNADQFPLAIKTAAYPPIVKFAAAPFGIIERYAHAPPNALQTEPASVPLSLRSVEAALVTRELAISAGTVSDYATRDDKEVLRWYARVQRLNESRLTAKQIEDVMADRLPRSEDKPLLDTRGYSVLGGKPNVRKLVMPGVSAENPRPFEVIGIPLEEPGFHVLEVESARLGQSLLASGQSMFVRSSVLLTNLGVHIKKGRDDILAWVTTLDDGKAVPGAAVSVLDCVGNPVANGITNDDGVWHLRQAIQAPEYCDETGLSGLYVSARIDAGHPQAHGKADFSFAFSSWSRGIEPWRFNVPVDTGSRPSTASHTVFDRTLLRAGETVSMKHFVRVQTRDGLALPAHAEDRPQRLLIEHQGSGQRYEQALVWQATPTGGLSALSHFDIPKTAKLGIYTVRLTDDKDTWYGSSEFRVEEFKLPLLSGHIKVADAAGAGVLVAPTALRADVQISFISGGPAGGLPVQVSGVVRDRWLRFPGYEDYSFNPPEALEGEAEAPESQRQKLFLDKKPLVLDAQGGARLSIGEVPAISRPQELLFEASFADPNGQIQTLSQLVPVWPAKLQAGIRGGSWIEAGKPARLQALALSLDGKPRADADMIVTAIARTVYSTRKRMVGGFYSYENHTESRDLGTVCEGRTGPEGVLECSVDLKQAGSIQLIASARDDQGRVSEAASTIWVMGGGELWFGGENDDRIDIIPARKNWKPGETAQFQVRMPFREATALVAVEREGVLKTQLVELKGSEPTVSIPIEAHWGPNVYVSVLALRGRLFEVPWYSFLTWGWKQPATWYSSYEYGKKNPTAPTALIDLAKPAFRFGLAEIHVSDTQDELAVKVSADKSSYQVREQAKVSIQVTTADGKPASHGSVAFAAVDEALLELSPNESWNLLSALRQLRSYGVETATAQMEIVGRRHYGRKALPAGGGGGKSPTRELLDTLLLWSPQVELDDQGRATITVPLNDAITRFRLVAIADYGADRFGTGETTIVSTQDLQVIPGLPALIREGDHYQALLTVRNATQRSMQVEFGAGYTGSGVVAGQLPAQRVELAAGAAHTASWDIEAPLSNLLLESTSLRWTLQAREVPAESSAPAQAPASDALIFMQQLIPAIPVRTQQATLLALDASQGPVSLSVAPPAEALLNTNGVPRGGLQLHMQTSLGGELPGVREWFESYPYTCLEQVSSRAIALRSAAQWEDIMRRLPDYLDDDGLAGYFPGATRGSEVLTAYLLAASHEAQSINLNFVIPEAQRSAMVTGLLGFAQGKVVRQHWAPRRDVDERKLLVLEALSRYALVKPRMLDSIAIAPDRWSTSAVIDWLAVLQRLASIPERKTKMSQARQILLARMLDRGTELVFAEDPRNEAPWLMVGRASNLARLILIVASEQSWAGELPRMTQGLLAMQRNAAWDTTTANLLGSLAIQKFASQYEKEPVSGQVEMRYPAGGEARSFTWEARKPGKGDVQSHDVFEAWSGAKPAALTLQQQGTGTAWATVRSLAAVSVRSPVVAGYELQRSVEPVSRAAPGVWSRGDVYRVKLTIKANAPTTWAVLTDPVPGGATILGGGLGRDSSIAAQGTSSDRDAITPSFIERSFESYRAYFDFLPAGLHTLEYTVRLNTAGQFLLPPTRIEAMYQPDVHGELPDAGGLRVQARPN